MRPGSKVYATRIAFAIVAGVLSAVINPMLFVLRPQVPAHAVVAFIVPMLIAMSLYMASYHFAKSVIKVSPTSLNDPSYIHKGGIFTYIIIWIVTWSLTATICCPSLLR
jgi:hypothetical protein